jgi:hypothetical protein
MKRSFWGFFLVVAVAACFCAGGYEAIAWYNARGQTLHMTAYSKNGEGCGTQISQRYPHSNGSSMRTDCKENIIALSSVSFELRTVTHSGFLVRINFHGSDRRHTFPAGISANGLVFFPYGREKTCVLDNGVEITGRFVESQAPLASQVSPT